MLIAQVTSQFPPVPHTFSLKKDNSFFKGEEKTPIVLEDKNICPDRKFTHKLCIPHNSGSFFYRLLENSFPVWLQKINNNFEKNLSRCSQLYSMVLFPFFFHPISRSPHSECRFSNFQNMDETALLSVTLAQSQRHCLKSVKSYQSKHGIKSKRDSHLPPDQCTYA